MWERKGRKGLGRLHGGTGVPNEGEGSRVLFWSICWFPRCKDTSPPPRTMANFKLPVWCQLAHKIPGNEQLAGACCWVSVDLLGVPTSGRRGIEWGDGKTPNVDPAHGVGLKHSQTVLRFSSAEGRRCRGTWVAQANMGGTETASKWKKRWASN